MKCNALHCICTCAYACQGTIGLNLAIFFLLVSNYYRSKPVKEIFKLFLLQQDLLTGAVAGTISVSNMTKPTSGFIYFGVSAFRATIVFACPARSLHAGFKTALYLKTFSLFLSFPPSSSFCTFSLSSSDESLLSSKY